MRHVGNIHITLCNEVRDEWNGKYGYRYLHMCITKNVIMVSGWFLPRIGKNELKGIKKSHWVWRYQFAFILSSLGSHPSGYNLLLIGLHHWCQFAPNDSMGEGSHYLFFEMIRHMLWIWISAPGFCNVLNSSLELPLQNYIIDSPTFAVLLSFGLHSSPIFPRRPCKIISKSGL